MRKIMYIHGFKSSANSYKAKILKQKFGEEYIISKTLPVAPIEAINFLQELLADDDDIGLIIGSSLGGFFALYLSIFNSLRAILINPSLKPYETLKKNLGENTRFDSDEKFELTQEHLMQYRALSEEIEHLNFDQKLLYFYLSKDDEILDHSDIPNKFPKAAKIQYFENSTHRFLNFEDILEEIEEMI